MTRAEKKLQEEKNNLNLELDFFDSAQRVLSSRKDSVLEQQEVVNYWQRIVDLEKGLDSAPAS